MALGDEALDDVSVLPAWLACQGTFIRALLSSLSASTMVGAAAAKSAVRFLAHHTGLPALLVAAILVVVGYRILKRTARFAVEVAVIGGVLLTATELGWIRW